MKSEREKIFQKHSHTALYFKLKGKKIWRQKRVTCPLKEGKSYNKLKTSQHSDRGQHKENNQYSYMNETLTLTRLISTTPCLSSFFSDP